MAAEEPRVGDHLAEAMSGEQDGTAGGMAFGGYLGRGPQPARGADQRHPPPGDHPRAYRNLGPALQPRAARLA